MRKFRFVGDPSDMHWYINPEKGGSYDILQLNAMRNGDLLEFWMIENDRSWIEVTDSKPHIIDIAKPLHKDTDLGYYVGLAMSAMVSRDPANSGWSDGASDQAIYIAKSIIKQLNN